ncbi:MAG: RNA 2',3'-cyclic phosphodiesterase [Anaerolineaceae bacterium]|jgi:2'-5' RNA ligase|nr:RNA 2',3'-cyclic phosphodiesterase [Anaerolineaceae bacterium]MDD4042038.1 RNA 2',3'-cyclic phosphodiesterase [Anaerolineaceae bacterium]MDD4578802.1 RNA 2',3'-cyclic phosphodiesterase [Anaerolineaceae bacterium]
MKKRLFIAIKLNESTLIALRQFQNELKQALPYKGIRWVDPALFHLTLQFLGDTEASLEPKLAANLEFAAKKCTPFALNFAGAGFFGSKSSVRTLWAGTQPASEMRKLFDQVIAATSFLEAEKRVRFSPHLTLARGSNGLTRDESIHISETISANNNRDFGVTEVRSFELIESILKPSGPVYKTVRIFNLV